MSENDVVAAFAGADGDEWLVFARNIALLEVNLDTLRRVCHNVWIAGWKARCARQDGVNQDKVRELDERAVEAAKDAKAAAVKARAQMGNLKLNLELYEL